MLGAGKLARLPGAYEAINLRRESITTMLINHHYFLTAMYIINLILLPIKGCSYNFHQRSFSFTESFIQNCTHLYKTALNIIQSSRDLRHPISKWYNFSAAPASIVLGVFQKKGKNDYRNQNTRKSVRLSSINGSVYMTWIMTISIDVLMYTSKNVSEFHS